MTVTTFLGDESPRQRPAFAARPVVMGTRGVVTSGHYLATAAGFRIMEQGGNAIDAAAAMCFCLNLLEPQSNGLAGEVPTLIYSARERKVHALSGMGWSPQAFTIDWCREHGIDLIPGDGYLPACVPAVVGTWAAALARFGTLRFSDNAPARLEVALPSRTSISHNQPAANSSLNKAGIPWQRHPPAWRKFLGSPPSRSPSSSATVYWSCRQCSTPSSAAKPASRCGS